MKLIKVLALFTLLSGFFPTVSNANEDLQSLPSAEKMDRLVRLHQGLVRRNQEALERFKNDRRRDIPAAEVMNVLAGNWADCDQAYLLSENKAVEVSFKMMRERINREKYHTDNAGYQSFTKERVLEEFSSMIEDLDAIDQIIRQSSPLAEPTAEAQKRLSDLQGHIERLDREHKEKEKLTSGARNELAQLEGQIAALKYKANELNQLTKHYNEAKHKTEKTLELLKKIHESFSTGEFTVEDSIGNLDQVSPEVRGEIAAIVHGFLSSKLNEVTMTKKADWQNSPLSMRVKAHINAFEKGRTGGFMKDAKAHVVTISVSAAASIPWSKRTSSTDQPITLSILDGQVTINEDGQVGLMDVFSKLGESGDALYAETQYHTLPDMLKALLDKGVPAEQIENAMFRVNNGLDCNDIAGGKKPAGDEASLEAELAQETPNPGTQRSPKAVR